jgi:hypothetical protein
MTFSRKAADVGTGCDGGCSAARFESAGIMSSMSDTAKVIIVAVPTDAVRELQSRNLAFPLAVPHGTAFDAVATVGADAATLVSLMQAPSTLRPKNRKQPLRQPPRRAH